MALDVNLMFLVTAPLDQPSLVGWFEKLSSDTMELFDISYAPTANSQRIAGVLTFKYTPTEKDILNFQARFVEHVPEYADIREIAYCLMPKEGD